MPVTQVASLETDDRTDTRKKIKVAARRLFAERGVEGVTVRQIVAAAGAKNGGSLNYYFKSKEGLILDLINEIFSDLNTAWLEGLSALDKTGGPTCVRDIVNLIVRSPNEVTYSDPSPTAHRFLASVLFTRRKQLSDYLEQMRFSVFRRLLQLIANLRSDIAAPVMRQRLVYFAWYLLSVQAALEAWKASRKRVDLWTQVDPLDNLVDTATALLEAGTSPRPQPSVPPSVARLSPRGAKGKPKRK